MVHDSIIEELFCHIWKLLLPVVHINDELKTTVLLMNLGYYKMSISDFLMGTSNSSVES